MLTPCQSAHSALTGVDQAKLVTEGLSAPDSRPNEKQRLIAIHALYGLIDGASISSSLIKSFFDVACAGSRLSSADSMHDWMMTKSGLSIAVTETIAIISLSLIANITDEDDRNVLLRFIARVWPYLRDAFKSLRNAYRSIDGTFKLFKNLFNYDLSHLTLPISIGMGVVSMVNRVLARYTRGERNSKAKANGALLEKILVLPLLSKEAYVALGPIQYETTAIGAFSLGVAAYSGFVDGIYLYMGVLSLPILTPPWFLAIVTLTVIFSLLCIVSRIYEIYNDQRELRVTQDKIHVALCGKELQSLLMQVQEANCCDKIQDSREAFMQDFYIKLAAFEEKCADLQASVTLSNWSAFFAGVRGGLAVYGAIASLIFAMSSMTILMGIAFPPYLITGSVLAGLLCLIAIVCYSYCSNAKHQYRHQPEQQLSKVVEDMLCRNTLQRSAINQEAQITAMINEEMDIHPSPQVLYQEGSEIFRSSCSGLGKGQKLVDYFLFWLQKQDKQGHYSDTPFMYWVMAFSVTVSVAVLAKRAYMAYELAVERSKANSSVLLTTTTVDSSSSANSMFQNRMVFFNRQQKSDFQHVPSCNYPEDNGLIVNTATLVSAKPTISG